MKTKLSILFVFLVTVSLFNCAGSSHLMQPAQESEATYQAGADEAIVVFMRPSGMAFAIQSSVFDVSDGETEKLVGVVSAKKKVVYRTQPGKHIFMVFGENADFMQAELEAGKIYYSVISPRMGVWKARFSLGAVHYNMDQTKLKNWLSGCELVENSEASFNWAEKHRKNIKNKHHSYMAKWVQKPEDRKPTLHPQDGF